MTLDVLDARCRDLLQEASQWRLISLLLAAPRGDWRRQVAALGSETHDRQLKEAAVLADIEADEGLYDSTFGPGGPAPPREITYRPALLTSQFLAELSGHYKAFGYVAPYEEPVDHVAVEADFVAYLKLKEAFAYCRGDDELAATAGEAVARLLSEHLAFVAAPLAERLADSDVRYFALSAQALLARTGRRASTPHTELPVLAELSDEVLTCCQFESPDRDH
jgi:nitrate reductase assembly molybdenum cofactor insertion protein NarJ